jgi:hypothetical protein
MISIFLIVECWKIAFDKSGRNIATCGELGTIKFFDVETKETVNTIKSSDIFATCIAIVIIIILIIIKINFKKSILNFNIYIKHFK